MRSILETAKIQDGRPGPVYIGNGKTYCGPVWKDDDGCFVVYDNERVAVGFDKHVGQWQRRELICGVCGRSKSIGCGCGHMPYGC